MAVPKKLSVLKEWYARRSAWAGWLGIALVAASFVVKEILPEHYKAKGEEITKCVATLEADDAEKRQVADTRSYGADKPDVMESILVRLEATEKLCANDGYYIARIERLDKNDEIADSGFLTSKHLSETMLENAVKTIFTRSFTAMVNIGELKKEGRSVAAPPLQDITSKSLISDSDVIFRDEGRLEALLDQWSEQQRKSLEMEKKAIEAKSNWTSAIAYLFFAVGWLITVAEKAIGKGSPAGEAA